MPDVYVNMTIMGRRIQVLTRSGNAGSLYDGVRVIKGKPLTQQEVWRVTKRVKHFLNKNRGNPSGMLSNGLDFSLRYQGGFTT